MRDACTKGRFCIIGDKVEQNKEKSK